MEGQLRSALAEFSRIQCISDRRGLGAFDVQFSEAPHKAPKPLRDQYAVYFFFKDRDWLKIGRTGYSPPVYEPALWNKTGIKYLCMRHMGESG